MAVELYNSITNVDNIALQETLVDVLTTTGQLLIFFGPTFGGTVFGAIAVIFALGAFRAAEELQRQIQEALNAKNKKDDTDDDVVVDLDPSKIPIR